jgi:hypothetical protein
MKNCILLHLGKTVCRLISRRFFSTVSYDINIFIDITYHFVSYIFNKILNS